MSNNVETDSLWKMGEMKVVETIESVNKIEVPRSESKLKKDLNRYVELSKELGATDARAIPASEVVVDPRTRLKCMYPVCHQSGVNAMCPPSPFVMDPEQTMKMRDLYRWALLVYIKATGDEFIDPRPPKDRGSPLPGGMLHHASAIAMRIYGILSEVESQAFYDGYYYAVGFGSGPCYLQLCHMHKDGCTLAKGEECRHPLRARPAAEAVGIDSFVNATKQGWDIYPVGQRSMTYTQPTVTRIVTIFID